MAGTRQVALIAVLLSGWLAGASAGRAQPVPLPTPAPLPKEGSIARPAPTAQPAAPAAPAPSGLSSFLDRLFPSQPLPQPVDPSGFDSTQRALISKVSNYLTSVQAVTGNFVQIGPDGRRAAGQLFIQKPGKVRFEYDPPSPIDIIADGQTVVVRDRQLGTQDPYPLSQTPLRFLLSDRIDLLRDTKVVGISADESFVTINIEEVQPLIGTNRLMMMFDAKDYRLKQWTVTDVQGFDTTIAVSNLDSSKRPDPGLFKIDYTRYPQ
jgi:outer membrane lipoprotein-sorting protein